MIAHRERLTSQLREATPQLPTREQLQILCAEIRRVVEDGNPDAVKQLLRDLIDRVEITPDRRAYPYFWVPASCDPAPTRDERGPNAQPAPCHQEDTGWLFVTSRGGGASKSQPLRIPGEPFYLGERKPAVLTCRDEVAAAVEALAASGGEPGFSVEMVHAAMVSCGSRWSRGTVAKTMLRMRRPARRPPYLQLERAVPNSYRVVPSRQRLGCS